MLINLIVISLTCCGAYLVTTPNYIGYPVRQLLEKIPHLLYAPLLGCVTCMGSVWGSIGWYLLDGQLNHLLFYPFAVAFLNTSIYYLYELVKEKIQELNT